MVSHPSTAADLAADPHSQLPETGQFARQDRWPAQNRPRFRAYKATYLSPNTQIEDHSHIAPIMDVFEDAFSAFGRGTLIATPNGQVAIEDLLPGDLIQTAHSGARPLLWKGSIDTIPNLSDPSDADRSMTRISADSLGMGRPMPDLILGASARLYNTSSTVQSTLGLNGVFTPAQDYIDGVQIIGLRPVSTVTTFHLALDTHDCIFANGIQVESYHPADANEHLASFELRASFKSLFPHINELSDFGGQFAPRMSLLDIENVNAA